MPGIGATLREAREQAHLDIMDFESRTKIRAKYLRALEDEEWSLLPGYTFTKGFLRTYADMLGLDGRALVDEFKRQYRDPSELDAPAHATAARRGEPRRSSRERPREQGGERAGRGRQQRQQQQRPSRPSRPSLVIAVIVLVILIVGALYAVGVLLPRSKKPHTATSSTTSTHTHSTSTTTTTSHSTTTHRAATKRKLVALKLLPTASVYVCLVGYPGASNRHPHIRLKGVTLVPHQLEPTRHDNHFHITVGNGSIVLLINNRRHPLSGSNPASYDITLGGRLLPLAPSQVPNCG